MADIYSVIRTEKKYSISPACRMRLSGLLEKIMDGDAHNGKDGYLVRSLYFDSIFDDDYIDKINGTETRKKIRLRVYDPDQKTVKLEIKQKQGADQQKRSLVIPREAAVRIAAGDYSPLIELKNPLALELYSILQLGTYRPRCIIEYRRTAFVEPANDIRVTLDSEIGVSGDCSRFFSAELPLIPVYDGTVLEVKYNGFLLSAIKQAVSAADETEVSMSKYAMSRSMIG